MSAVPSRYIGVYETLSGSHGDDRIDENRNRPARRSGSSAIRVSMGVSQLAMWLSRDCRRLMIGFVRNANFVSLQMEPTTKRP